MNGAFDRYHFVKLDDYVAMRDSLDQWCREHCIKGTLLMAAEGINGTISGAEDDVVALLAHRTCTDQPICRSSQTMATNPCMRKVLAPC